MQKINILSVVFGLLGCSAMAGGIDRSGQPLEVLFKDGNYAQLSFGYVFPNVNGDDISGAVAGIPTDAKYKEVAKGFPAYGFGLKYQVNEQFSLALIGNEDFGSDIKYDEIAGSNLGGTQALADSYAVSLIGRYEFTENWSAHAGLRADWAQGEITLNGLAYGGPSQPPGSPIPSGVSGYNVDLDSDLGFGYLVGGAYERPDIAMRVALTYFSAIEHDFETTETFALDLNGDRIADTTVSPETSTTKVKTPQAINLDLQTGIAPNTLLFGGIRWSEWSEFLINPETFAEATGATLVSLDDTITYRIGLAHRLNENWAVQGSFAYEKPQDRLVSPLAPSTGLQQIGLGAVYTYEKMEVAAGARYSWLGKGYAETGTPDVARATFGDSTALSVGLRVGFYF